MRRERGERGEVRRERGERGEVRRGSYKLHLKQLIHLQISATVDRDVTICCSHGNQGARMTEGMKKGFYMILLYKKRPHTDTQTHSH